MLPKHIVLMNKILLAIFSLAIVYSYSSTPPQNIARVIGQIIPLAVLATTLTAAKLNSKLFARVALIANAIVCLMASGVFFIMAGANSILSGVFMLFVLLPFFINLYFLIRHKIEN